MTTPVLILWAMTMFSGCVHAYLRLLIVANMTNKMIKSLNLDRPRLLNFSDGLARDLYRARRRISFEKDRRRVVWFFFSGIAFIVFLTLMCLTAIFQKK